MWGENTTTQLQLFFGTPVDGEVSRQQEVYQAQHDGCTTGWEWLPDPDRGSALIKVMQELLHENDHRYHGDFDGWAGPQFAIALEEAAGIKNVTGRLKKGGAAIKRLQTTLNRRFAGEEPKEGDWF